MDPWKECVAWQECRDAVRAWAELEGKSSTMSEDLIRSVADRPVPKRNSLTAPASLMHVAIVALNVLRMFRSG